MILIFKQFSDSDWLTQNVNNSGIACQFVVCDLSVLFA